MFSFIFVNWWRQHKMVMKFWTWSVRLSTLIHNVRSFASVWKIFGCDLRLINYKHDEICAAWQYEKFSQRIRLQNIALLCVRVSSLLTGNSNMSKQQKSTTNNLIDSTVNERKTLEGQTKAVTTSGLRVMNPVSCIRDTRKSWSVTLGKQTTKH
jgi:hypothetical protein